MQINDILIVVNDVFASNKGEIIKVAKIMIKDCKYFMSVQPIKFNSAQIQQFEKYFINKKSHISDIFFLIDHDKNSTSLNSIIKIKLLLKK